MAQYRNVCGLVHMNTNSSVTVSCCSLFYACILKKYIENRHFKYPF